MLDTLTRVFEFLLGLEKGFLKREGDWGVTWNSRWPLPEYLPSGLWNFLLIAAGLLLVTYVYRREGRSRGVRIVLATLRLVIVAFVIAMLNRPVLTVTQTRTEPSVLAFMIDDSISMSVRDALEDDPNATRLDAAIQLVEGEDQKLLKDLAKDHILRFYRFNQNAQPFGPTVAPTKEPLKLNDAVAPVVAAMAQLKPVGQSSQILNSVQTVLDDLQGQRLAGIIMLTDGRSMPPEARGDQLLNVRGYGVKVFPIAIGSDKAPTNIGIDSVNVQDSAFKGDVVALRATIRATGYPKGHPVRVVAKNKKTGEILTRPDGKLDEATIIIDGDQPQEVELPFKAGDPGMMDVEVEVVKEDGEIDPDDNARTVQVAVLDVKISVLYADGYPRWEYRYLVREMIRDKTVNISSFLFSADAGFVQDADPQQDTFPGPITRFPDNIKELMAYDVVLIGDVDRRQFTDRQLDAIQEFVSKKGGGFGMVAGQRWSPSSYAGTPIEALLPVSLTRLKPDDAGPITVGFRPVPTREGEASAFFRFIGDKLLNDKYLKEDLQPIFWFTRGVMVKPGVGEVYAEHPTEVGPDGRKAPLLVVGRYGTGRTLFSAIDDSWRWRFYTGEQVFDTYWLQQIRYLARSRKLGQRKYTVTTLRPVYELNDGIKLNLRVLDPDLLQQLPDQVGVDIKDAAGNPLRRETFIRQEGQPELFVATWSADTIGKFTARPTGLTDTEAAEVPFAVAQPKLELSQPQLDRTLLTQLAEPIGAVVTYDEARKRLPSLLTSAEVKREFPTGGPLWDAPLALTIFVLLITVEWILRKVFGML